MTVEERIANSAAREFGVDKAIIETQQMLDLAMEGDSIRNIELQHFWREILVQLMKKRH